MRPSTMTRWIRGLLFLAVICIGLVQAPPFHDFAALLWGVALASLFAALIVGPQPASRPPAASILRAMWRGCPQPWSTEHNRQSHPHRPATAITIDSPSACGSASVPTQAESSPALAVVVRENTAPKATAGLGCSSRG